MIATEKHEGEGKNGQPYNYVYYMHKYSIPTTEVLMSLREIRYGSARELDEFLTIKLKK